VYRHDANVIFMSMIAGDTLITRKLLISKLLQPRANLGDLWEIHPLPPCHNMFYSLMPRNSWHIPQTITCEKQRNTILWSWETFFLEALFKQRYR